MLINQKTMSGPMVPWPTVFNRLKANKGPTKALPEQLCKQRLMIHVKIDVGFFYSQISLISLKGDPCISLEFGAEFAG